jgi:hypothetical protein
MIKACTLEVKEFEHCYSWRMAWKLCCMFETDASSHSRVTIQFCNSAICADCSVREGKVISSI